MPYMISAGTGQLTMHTFEGRDQKGRSIYRCQETGETRGPSKAKMDQIRAQREWSKEQDLEILKDAPVTPTGGPLPISNDNIEALRVFLQNESS